ncbi:hypothetical protein ACFL3S_12625 [Gemmatimonadota bacterium]
MFKATLVPFLFLLFVSGPVCAQEQDVQFLLLGKTRNHRQSATGDLTFLNTVFFGEIFLNEGGTVTNAKVTGPGDAEGGLFFGGQEVPFFAGDRHSSIQSLEEHFPDGTYYFHFDTPHGTVRDFPVTFSKRGRESGTPAPIRMTLHQHGQVADPHAIDPDEDLLVTWSEFEHGAADPNGVIDDLIFVIMGDCLGVKTVHSGHAFGSSFLTYADEEFTIPKESLRPGQPFQIEIEFSEMDTAKRNDLVSIVTYAASTFLDIRTTGANEDEKVCPPEPLAMDGGQTDRKKPGG